MENPNLLPGRLLVLSLAVSLILPVPPPAAFALRDSIEDRTPSELASAFGYPRRPETFSGLEEKDLIKPNSRLVAGDPLFSDAQGVGFFVRGSLQANPPRIWVRFWNREGKPYLKEFGDASLGEHGLDPLRRATEEQVARHRKILIASHRLLLI